MSTFTIKGYHGTDKRAAYNILQKGFQCKNNEEHWLGNGIYLYTDMELAKWWTTSPTKRHGVEIITPVVVECDIEVNEDNVLNLCTLNGYKEYVGLYNRFFDQCIHRARKNAEINFKQLRSAFFNCLFLSCDIDMVMAPFILPDQPYMPQYFDTEHANAMHISYPEIQVCISPTKQNVIKNKRIHSL